MSEDEQRTVRLETRMGAVEAKVDAITAEHATFRAEILVAVTEIKAKMTFVMVGVGIGSYAMSRLLTNALGV